MIHANELMIGDWVCTEHDSTPRQIDWIRTGEVGLLWNKAVTPPYLVPIPITPEILEKNGFIEDSTNGLHSEYHLLVPAGIEKNLYTVQVTFYKEPICGVSTLFKCWGPYSAGVNDIHLCNLNYVHEMQHAIRLCGVEKEIVL